MGSLNPPDFPILAADAAAASPGQHHLDDGHDDCVYFKTHYTRSSHLAASKQQSRPRGPPQQQQHAPLRFPKVDRYPETTFVGRSFPGLQWCINSYDDGVIFTFGEKHTPMNLYISRQPRLYRLLLFSSVLICIIILYWQKNWQSEEEQVTRRISPIPNFYQLPMAGILRLLALASPALSAVIGSRADASNPAISVPASPPTNASPNVDPSFPGFAFELASVVEYAQGQFTSLVATSPHTESLKLMYQIQMLMVILIPFPKTSSTPSFPELAASPSYDLVVLLGKLWCSHSPSFHVMNKA